MAIRERADDTGETAFHVRPRRERTTLRDNLEYFAVLILVVLLLRQVVVEAFRIQYGSMAPTLVSTHQEVRCPSCGWVFDVGSDKAGTEGEIECPNCRYRWTGASEYDRSGQPILFRDPEWLWNAARLRSGPPLQSTDAANRIYRGASRIFVNKFIYSLREPRRWEVVVFLYPFYSVQCRDCHWRAEEVESTKDLVCPVCGSRDIEVSTKNFIKRLVGLPGETIELKDGDVYADGVIQRKPPNVQAQLWLHVFDSAFSPRQNMGSAWWDAGGNRERCVADSSSGMIRVDAQGVDEPVMAAFGRRIMDSYAYDGLSYEASPRSLGAAGRFEVGDCRISARARLLSQDPAGGAAVLEIGDAGHVFEFTVGAGGGTNAVLEADGTPVRQTSVTGLSANRPQWIALENYDDRVVCKVGGREVLRYDYRAGSGGRRRVRLGARGATVLWERVVIERDIYYVNVGDYYEAPPAYELGAGQYFVLGDNSPVSRDSRNWKKPGVPVENLIGRAFFVFWPVHQMKWLNGG